MLVGPAPPRVRHAPSVRANSWEDVSDLSASLGMPLDDWQEDVFAAAMGERSDGRWASRFVALSTPRQNGKSQLIVARALAGVLLFDEQTIICSFRTFALFMYELKICTFAYGANAFFIMKKANMSTKVKLNFKVITNIPSPDVQMLKIIRYYRAVNGLS